MWQSTFELAASSRRGAVAWCVRSFSLADIDRHYLQLLGLAQSVVVFLAAVFAKWLYLDFILLQSEPYAPYLALASVLAITLHCVNRQMGLDRWDLMGPTIGFGRIWGGLAVAFMVTLGGLYLSKLAEHYSRGWFVCWFVICAVAIVVVRWGFIKGLTELAAIGRVTRRFAVLGTTEYVNALSGELSKVLPHVVITNLYLSDDSSEHAKNDLDTIRELRAALQVKAFERVIIALPALDKARIRVAYSQLAPFAPEILLCTVPRAVPLPVHGSKSIGNLTADVVIPVPTAEQYRLEKRIFDCACALFGLMVLSPIILLAAIAIKLDSSGPVFFRQRRYGRNNRVFRIFKFRTMTVLEDDQQVMQARRNDSRVTYVGRILRSTSIDELPQLLNVLLGHMSIVGPRPHALAHEERFEEYLDLFSRRRRVLPGITGWAQVNGCRGETLTLEDVEKRMDYDLYYIDNWSTWFDLEIIFRTISTLSRGAY